MRRIFWALSLAVLVAAAAVVVMAQGPPLDSKAWIHIPDSTIQHLADIGVRAHTNHLIRVSKKPAPPPSEPKGMYPATLWSYYVESSENEHLAAGSKVIAIVDAYHYPTALNDFNYFSGQFNLPKETSTNALADTNNVFRVVYGTKTGKAPRTNCGWAQEAALDIEWAHAMAPNAKIILVEAATNSFADLFYAVNVATDLVAKAGGGQVSMSWGGSEFSTEATYDGYFTSSSSVVYFASSGDIGGKTIYPSVSPYVVAAGGTTLVFDANKNIVSETGWSGSGGGVSAYEPKPTYQIGISLIDSDYRGVPDISFDADPNTGVAVYDSTSCQGYVGWMVFGGTSVSAPALAGLTNSAGGFAADSASQLASSYTYPGFFNDIIGGTAGDYTAIEGWDFVTGLGTPNRLAGLK